MFTLLTKGGGVPLNLTKEDFAGRDAKNVLNGKGYGSDFSEGLPNGIKVIMT
jgi:hypothetical protein